MGTLLCILQGKDKEPFLGEILCKIFFDICDALQEMVTYVGKMNFEFSTKLGSEHPYHVPEEYKAYCSIEPEKQAYKV